MKERYALKQENPVFKTLPDLQILSDLELIERNGTRSRYKRLCSQKLQFF